MGWAVVFPKQKHKYEKINPKRKKEKKTNFCYKFIKAKNKKKLVHPEGEDYPCYIDVATAAAASTVLHCDHRKKEKKNTKWTWKA